MVISRIGLTITLLLAWTAAGSAAPTTLDIIPEDAAGALVGRNLEELRAKGEKLIKAHDLKLPIKFSDLFVIVFQLLGIGNSLDMTQPTGVVLANPVHLGLKDLKGAESNKLLVIVMPFKSLDGIASNFGFKKGELKPGQVEESKRNNNNFTKYLYVQGKYLFCGQDKKVVVSVAKSKPLAGVLPAKQRQDLAKADVLLHGGRAAIRESGLFLTGLNQLAQNGAERKVIERFFQVVKDVDHAFVTVQVETGIGLQFLALFQEKGKKERQKLLAEFGSGQNQATLIGLPGQRLVATHANSVDGGSNALLVKAIFNAVFKSFLKTDQVMIAADRFNYINVFTEIWQHLKGSRIAVYESDDEQSHGLFNILAVLDTEDPQKFVTNLRELAKLADGTALDLKNPNGGSPDVKRIEQLIRDLGSVRFKVRHSATTKLALAGEPVLPYLKKAMKSSDLEVRIRSERLASQIEQVAATRRKLLLSKQLPHLLHPEFAFVAKAEQRLGVPVHVVAAKLVGNDAAYTPQLRQLMGPDWYKIRLVPQGKHVVAFMGSDLGLLDATLQNLRKEQDVLTVSPLLKTFRSKANALNQVEFHVSVTRAMQLIGGQAPKVKAKKLTSFGLAVHPDLVQLDIWMPGEELKVILKDRWW